MRRLLGVAVVLAVVAFVYLRARHHAAPDVARAGDTSHAEGTHADISHAKYRARPLYLSDVNVAAGGEATAGSIAGHVLATGTGKPVAHAALAFFRGSSYELVADDAGAFRFVPPAPGSYELASVSAAGYRPYAGDLGNGAIRFEARPGQKLDGVTIYLAPARTLTVVVREPGGKPAAGADVRVLSSEHGMEGSASVTSDDKGEAQVVAEGEDLVEARKAGFVRARQVVGLAAEATGRLVLTLGSGAPPTVDAIGGRVVDGNGQPVDGALVEALPAGERPGARATSDGEGHFRLAELDAGDYVIRASATGRGVAIKSGVATGTRDLVLALASRGGIRGVVSDGRGKPLPGFTVMAAARIGSFGRGEPLSSTSFGGDGRYELLLPPGDYAVRVAAHGFAPSGERLVTVGDEVATLDFQLSRGGRVFGRVVERNGGAPIAGARVLVEGIGGGDGVTLASDTLSDGNGAFAVSGMPRGRQSLQVVATGHDGRIVSGLDVPSDGEVGPLTIDLRAIGKDEEPKLELVGIGVVIGSDASGIVIKSTAPTGGAAAAGLVAGDVILAVDGTSVEALGFPGAVQMLRGPESSTVTVSVRHVDGSTTVVDVERKRING